VKIVSFDEKKNIFNWKAVQTDRKKR